MPGAKLCTVYIRDRAGNTYATNVSATSTFAAVRDAAAFFRDNFWKWPKPAADTVCEVAVMGIERKFWIRVGDAEKHQAQHHS